MNGRERILAAIDNSPIDSLPFMPITMMFAADQIGKSYGEYALDYRVLVEGQIKTAEIFDIDQVSCISDPAREAADLGAAVEYYDNQPPAINENKALLSDKTKLADLKIPDPLQGRRMSDRVHAASALKERVGQEKLVEGWVEGPCAMAADLRGINNLMLDFYDDPTFVRDLFEFVVEMEINFAKHQVEAGVDYIGIGDAAASLVNKKVYDEFVWPYEKKLVDGLHNLGTKVRLHICGKTRRFYEEMGKLGCEIVDLDWMNPLDEARKAMGGQQILLGNIDPVNVLRDGNPDSVYQAIAECHQHAGQRYIVGAGCEVTRDTSPDNVNAMLRYARSHKPADLT